MTETTGHRSRLYKRFKKFGIDAFSEHEKLELLLTLVIPRKDCKPLAKNILKKFNNFFDFFYSEANDWKQISGIGSKTCLFLSIIKAIMGESMKESLKKKKSFKNPEEVGKYLIMTNSRPRKESFKILLLNVQYELLAEETISKGTIDEAPVYIRHIIEYVLQHNAKAVILSHNHPSDNISPSKADIDITQKIKSALVLLNIELLDHIIVGKSSFSSFVKEKLLPFS